jgi:hypothetical protein
MHIHGQVMNPSLMALSTPQSIARASEARRAAATRKHLASFAAAFDEDESWVGSAEDAASHYGRPGSGSGSRGGNAEDGDFRGSFSIEA